MSRPVLQGFFSLPPDGLRTVNLISRTGLAAVTQSQTEANAYRLMTVLLFSIKSTARLHRSANKVIAIWLAPAKSAALSSCRSTTMKLTF